ncbi:MAG: Trp family transcriptional regulator [Candidatus Gottesmanbacteria bacterium]
MPQVSKYPIAQAVYEQIFELLHRVFSESTSKEDASNLLEDLLTPTERIVLAKRLAIALLLSKGYSYSNIGKILRVSKPTIAAVNLSLKYEGKGYKKFCDRILSEEKIRDVWEKIEETVLSAIPTRRGIDPARYLRHELKRKRYQRSF